MKMRGKMYKLSSKKSILFILIALIIGAILCPSVLFSGNAKASAEGVSYNNYIFKKYHVSINVTDKNEYEVEENFTVLYGNPNAGLHKGVGRRIPLIADISKKVNGKKYRKTYAFKYSKVEANELYDYYKNDSSDLIIELGGDDYINASGSKEEQYTVKYTLSMGDDFIRDFDFIYYNIIGTDYPVRMLDVSFDVTLPYDTDSVPKFYTGLYGSVDNILDNVEKTIDSEGRLVFSGYRSELDPHEGISLDINLKEGYFKGLAGVVRHNNNLNIVIIVFCGVAVLALLILITWFMFVKKQPVETIEFYPPDDTTPVDATYLLKGAVNERDLTSLIIYWASKNLVKITLDQDNKPIVLKKLNNISEQVPVYEKMVFDAMFDLSDYFYLDQHNQETAKKISEAKKYVAPHNGKRFSKTCTIVRGLAMAFTLLPVLVGMIIEATRVYSIATYLILETLFFGALVFSVLFLKSLIIQHGYTNRFPLIMGFVVCVPIFLAFGYVLLGMYTIPLYIILMRIGVVIIYPIVSNLLIEYHSKIRDKMGKLLGFKHNLEVVEADKIKMLLDEDPEYFYNVLPYVYAFDINNAFIKKFNDIVVVENPNFGGVVDMVYISHIGHYSRTFTPKSEGGGGSGGGGGGSGGGGGGGGSFGR